MRIIDYDKSFDKEIVASEAYRISKLANFPVNYDDVYEHLFGNSEAILLLLINEMECISGFGAFENYEQLLDNQLISMLYLSLLIVLPL